MSRALADRRGTPIRPNLDVQLRRYDRSCRRRLRKFARAGDRLKDLVYTFPAAAFTITGSKRDPIRDKEAIRLVRGGAPLRDIGLSLNLPYWTRSLPPEAFVERLGTMPGSNGFSRRIVNQFPGNPRHSAMWLQWVLRGNALCDEAFAVWIARQDFWHENGPDAQTILPLAAFAWYSTTERTTARSLIDRPWKAKSSFGSALEAAQSWFVRCLNDYCNDVDGATGRWFVAQRSCRFRIVPLCTPKELVMEGKRMGNCVGSYERRVLTGASLIYSVRRRNAHVATMDIRPRSDRSGQPVIAQLLGPGNAPVREDVMGAAKHWLSRQGPYPFVGAGALQHMPFNKQRWADLWAPFMVAKNVSGLDVQPLAIKRAIERLSLIASSQT